MSLISIVITLLVIGVLLYLVERYIPMDRAIKNIVRILVIFVVVIWLLQSLGVLGSLSAVHIR